MKAGTYAMDITEIKSGLDYMVEKLDEYRGSL